MRFSIRRNAAEAVEYYRTALALRPETTSLRYALGGHVSRPAPLGRAIAEFEQAIRLDPENAWCHNRLGVHPGLAGRPRRRGDRRSTAKSIRLDPTIGWSHHHLAVALETQGPPRRGR